MSAMKLNSAFIKPVGMLARQQPFLAPRIVFSQVPKTTVLGIRSYATNQQNQGKQILLRDHGVFGKPSLLFVTLSCSFLVIS